MFINQYLLIEMKKKIVSIIIVVVIATTVSFGFIKNKTEISDLTLSNVEALASEWVGGNGSWGNSNRCGYHAYQTCFYTYSCGFQLCYSNISPAEYR